MKKFIFFMVILVLSLNVFSACPNGPKSDMTSSSDMSVTQEDQKDLPLDILELPGTIIR